MSDSDSARTEAKVAGPAAVFTVEKVRHLLGAVAPFADASAKPEHPVLAAVRVTATPKGFVAQATNRLAAGWVLVRHSNMQHLSGVDVMIPVQEVNRVLRGLPRAAKRQGERVTIDFGQYQPAKEAGYPDLSGIVRRPVGVRVGMQSRVIDAGLLGRLDAATAVLGVTGVSLCQESATGPIWVQPDQEGVDFLAILMPMCVEKSWAIPPLPDWIPGTSRRD